MVALLGLATAGLALLAAVLNLIGKLDVLLGLALFPIKVLIALLNVCPSRVFVTHGHMGFVGDAREQFAKVKGESIGCGFAIVACLRGHVRKREGLSGRRWWGLYPEHYEAIVAKWAR